MMTLREMVIERILFAVTEEELVEDFMIEADALAGLSDVDLFELFEDVLLYVQ